MRPVWLLEKGVDSNVKSQGCEISITRDPKDAGKYDYGFILPGDTALISATRGEHVTTVNVLLSEHADCNLQNDNSGDTELHVATHIGNLAIVYEVNLNPKN